MARGAPVNSMRRRPVLACLAATTVLVTPALAQAPAPAPSAPADDTSAPVVDADVVTDAANAADNTEHAEEEAEEEKEGEEEEEEGKEEEGLISGGAGATLVRGRRNPRRVVGSAQVITEETLDRFEADDVHRILRGVPGVYVRDEDGTGLRPNIGIRGANSDRSSKVTLLEDGVLLGPAPYAAPAAYYFPLTARMTAIEVWKGPAAIRQGPHTIGGAVNLRTRPVPSSTMGSLDLGIGLVGPGREQTRLHGFVGDSAEFGDITVGALLEGARASSDGFKVIDGQGDANTGFVRDDMMLKLRVSNSLLADVHHVLEVKLGVQREDSNETYLGTSDEDFRADPRRRYAASMSDRMTWLRTQAQLRYNLSVAGLDVDVVGYRHDMDRTWNKVNGVRGAGSLHEVLGFADVGVNPIYMARLQSLSELPDDDVAVLIGPNHRTYASQGVAAVARYRLDVEVLPTLVLSQGLEVGVRLHNDRIRREHDEQGFFVVDNNLVRADDEVTITARNEGEATALALYAADEVRLGPVLVVPGARLELIHGRFHDELRGADHVTSDQIAFVPGVGVGYDIAPWATLIGGVHRGFSPVAPGQTGDVKPEESTNSELGVRFDVIEQLGLRGEVIGFASWYGNIVGECTYSSGCVDDTGRQTNGGEALIGGTEVALQTNTPLHLLRSSDRLSLDAAFTFTNATFLTSFDSPFPLFGNVQAGDELAYIPPVQAALTAAVLVGPVDAGVSLGLISPMRDVPGQGPLAAGSATDAQAVVDVTVGVELVPGWVLTTRIDNVLDQQAIVSRRPFGARASKPRSILLSLEARFGS
jgi:Fe(3+) dicitrate transport protein